MTEEDKYLIRNYGFRKDEFDDKLAYWLKKIINHKLLGTIEIFIDSGSFYIDIVDNRTRDHVTICEMKYSREKLIEYLNFFDA